MSDAPLPRAIDAWVNVNMAEPGRPSWLVAFEHDDFERGEDSFRNNPVEEIVEAMDRLGVAKAIPTTDAEKPSRTCRRFRRRAPTISCSACMSIRGG